MWYCTSHTVLLMSHKVLNGSSIGVMQDCMGAVWEPYKTEHEPKALHGTCV